MEILGSPRSDPLVFQGTLSDLKNDEMTLILQKCSSNLRNWYHTACQLAATSKHFRALVASIAPQLPLFKQVLPLARADFWTVVETDEDNNVSVRKEHTFANRASFKFNASLSLICKSGDIAPTFVLRVRCNDHFFTYHLDRAAAFKYLERPQGWREALRYEEFHSIRWYKSEEERLPFKIPIVYVESTTMRNRTPSPTKGRSGLSPKTATPVSTKASWATGLYVLLECDMQQRYTAKDDWELLDESYIPAGKVQQYYYTAEQFRVELCNGMLPNLATDDGDSLPLTVSGADVRSWTGFAALDDDELEALIDLDDLKLPSYQKPKPKVFNNRGVEKRTAALEGQEVFRRDQLVHELAGTRDSDLLYDTDPLVTGEPRTLPRSAPAQAAASARSIDPGPSSSTDPLPPPASDRPLRAARAAAVSGFQAYDWRSARQRFAADVHAMFGSEASDDDSSDVAAVSGAASATDSIMSQPNPSLEADAPPTAPSSPGAPLDDDVEAAAPSAPPATEDAAASSAQPSIESDPLGAQKWLRDQVLAQWAAMTHCRTDHTVTYKGVDGDWVLRSVRRKQELIDMGKGKRTNDMYLERPGRGHRARDMLSAKGILDASIDKIQNDQDEQS